MLKKSIDVFEADIVKKLIQSLIYLRQYTII